MIQDVRHDTDRQLRDERSVTLWGLGANILLVSSKVAIGILARSSAIIADGLHSTSDLVRDFAVLWCISAAKRPADADHHYGHARYEAIVTLFIGILLVIAALFIGVESIVTLGDSHGGIRNWWPLWIALGSIVLKEILYRWTRAVGRRYRNSAVLANAWDHRSDAFSSAAAATGIAAALIGGPRWAFVDHLTAVVLAAFIVVVGFRIARDTLRRLADAAPHASDIEGIQRVIANNPGVRGFHAFRARHSGAGGLIEMDVHVQVDPSISVRDGHDIATRVEQEVHRANPDVSSVVVHIEPSENPK